MIDILDESGQVSGTMTRGEAEQYNHMTENVLVFIFNSLGRVWAQLRPITKNHYPGRWDISACGGMVSGETKEECAARETEEETGLKPELQFIKSFVNVHPGDNGEERRRLSHVFLGISDELPQPPPTKEVDEFKLWDTAELIADIAKDPTGYVPSFDVELSIALNAYRRIS